MPKKRSPGSDTPDDPLNGQSIDGIDQLVYLGKVVSAADGTELDLVRYSSFSSSHST